MPHTPPPPPPPLPTPAPTARQTRHQRQRRVLCARFAATAVRFRGTSRPARRESDRTGRVIFSGPRQPAACGAARACLCASNRTCVRERVLSGRENRVGPGTGVRMGQLWGGVCGRGKENQLCVRVCVVCGDEGGGGGEFQNFSYFCVCAHARVRVSCLSKSRPSTRRPSMATMTSLTISWPLHTHTHTHPLSPSLAVWERGKWGGGRRRGMETGGQEEEEEGGMCVWVREEN